MRSGLECARVRPPPWQRAFASAPSSHDGDVRPFSAVARSPDDFRQLFQKPPGDNICIYIHTPSPRESESDGRVSLNGSN